MQNKKKIIKKNTKNQERYQINYTLKSDLQLTKCKILISKKQLFQKDYQFLIKKTFILITIDKVYINQLF